MHIQHQSPMADTTCCWPCRTTPKETTPRDLQRQLRKATGHGNLPAIDKLVSQGADLASTQYSRLGENALHKAAKYGQTATLKKLLDIIDAKPELASRKASLLNLKNNYGQTPTDLAIMGMHHTNARLLLDQKEISPRPELFASAIISGNMAMARVLLADSRLIRSEVENQYCWSLLAEHATDTMMLPLSYVAGTTTLPKFSDKNLETLAHGLLKTTSNQGLELARKLIGSLGRDSARATLTNVLLTEALHRLNRVG